jgi:hypothetical protein
MVDKQGYAPGWVGNFRVARHSGRIIGITDRFTAPAWARACYHVDDGDERGAGCKRVRSIVSRL